MQIYILLACFLLCEFFLFCALLFSFNHLSWISWNACDESSLLQNTHFGMCVILN